MRRWGFPLGFLLVALACAFYYQQQQASGRAGFPAPNFTLKDINGRTYRLSDLRGKIVFLNLWATWCPPCREEMPSMEALHRRLQGTDFIMLAVSEDEGGSAAVRPFVDQMRLTFPVLMDPEGELPGRYGVTGYPETFIIDREGHVIQHTIGPDNWASEKAFRYFLKLLDQRPGTTQAGSEHAPSGG
jgi:peroxiredoxin